MKGTVLEYVASVRVDDCLESVCVCHCRGLVKWAGNGGTRDDLLQGTSAATRKTHGSRFLEFLFLALFIVTLFRLPYPDIAGSDSGLSSVLQSETTLRDPGPSTLNHLW